MSESKAIDTGKLLIMHKKYYFEHLMGLRGRENMENTLKRLATVL